MWSASVVIGFGLGAVFSYLVQAERDARTLLPGRIYLERSGQNHARCRQHQRVAATWAGVYLAAPWLGTLLGAGVGLWMGRFVAAERRVMRGCSAARSGLSLLVSLGMAICLNYFHC